MTRRHNIAPRRTFLDLETGGLDPGKHPIIQIAVVAFDYSWYEMDRFEVKLKFDEADCDPDALKKISYDRRLWSQHAVEPTTAYDRLCYFLREHATAEKFSREKGVHYHLARLYAHNARFDTAFLWHWHETLRATNAKLFLPADRQAICTLQAALLLFDQHPELAPPTNYRLGTLCDYFGLPFYPNEAHDALYDCLATARLYHVMTGSGDDIQLRRAA